MNAKKWSTKNQLKELEDHQTLELEKWPFGDEGKNNPRTKKMITKKVS
jgi:hypothetical protein